MLWSYDPRKVSKAKHPPIKLIGHSDVHRDAKMIVVLLHRHDIAAKAVDNGIHHTIMKNHRHGLHVIAEHGEGILLILRKVDPGKGFPPLPCDTCQHLHAFHAVHAIRPHFPMLFGVCKHIVVFIGVYKGIWADLIGLSILPIDFPLVDGVIEILVTDLFAREDGGVDVADVIADQVLFVLDAIRQDDITVKLIRFMSAA